MTSYYLEFNKNKKETRIVHVSDVLLSNSDYGFEIKEILSIVKAKPINQLDKYIHLKHIIMTQDKKDFKKISLILKSKGISSELISMNYVSKDVYASDLKYRKKIIINTDKTVFLFKSQMKSNTQYFQTRVINSIRRRLKKYLKINLYPSRFNNGTLINEEEFVELLSPSKSFIDFDTIDTSNIDNKRLEIIAVLSGLKVISDSKEKVSQDIKLFNNKLKQDMIDSLLLSKN